VINTRSDGISSTIPAGAHSLASPRKLQKPESPTPSGWLAAVRAAEEKQAKNIRVLDLREITSFADYFVVCTGSNSRQIQAVADEIQSRLKKQGEHASSIEGYQNAEWVLMDYGDFLVHVFSEKARDYYDLERLWRDAKPVASPDESA
jgi:ribosome-associated protein